MWAARTEVRRAGGAGDVQQHGRLVSQGAGLFQQVLFGKEGTEPRGNDREQFERRQLAGPRHQLLKVFVMFAHHPRRFGAGPVIKGLFELAFDDAAFLFDHKHFALAFHEVERVVQRQRPDHADLVDVDAEAAAGGLIQAQKPQRFHRVEVALAGGHDAESGALCVVDMPVNGIGAHEGLHRVELVMQPRLNLRRGQIAKPHVQPARRRGVVGLVEHAVGRQCHRCAAFHGFRDRLETHPSAREA